MRLSLDELSGDFAGGEPGGHGDVRPGGCAGMVAAGADRRCWAVEVRSRRPPDTEMSESNLTGGSPNPPMVACSHPSIWPARSKKSIESARSTSASMRGRVVSPPVHGRHLPPAAIEYCSFIKSPESVDVVWYLDDDDIVLEVIRLQSLDEMVVTFSLNGEGTFDWATKTISAILRPRSKAWIVPADVFGVPLQDRFYAVSVEGPVKDPQVELISFPDLQ